VLFGIYPAVNEKDDETAQQLNFGRAQQLNFETARQPNFETARQPLLQEGDTDAMHRAVLFGPKTRPDRHHRYRSYVLQASAWVATALRRLKSGRRYVKKWFVLDSDTQVDEQLKEARRHLTKMLSALGRLVIKKGVPEDEGGACSESALAGTLAYVWTRNECDIRSRYDCGEKTDGRYVVNICEFYWRKMFEDFFDASTRVGTIVHESSHHFGTDDKGYCGMIDCLRLSSEDARNNADSYTHLVEELVKSRLAEEALPSDLLPDRACNTPCDPKSFQDDWHFDKMLPE